MWKSFSCVWHFATPWTIQSWNSPGQNTGVGSLSLLHRIFPTQGSNPDRPHCTWIIYQLSHKRSPRILEWVAYHFFRGSSWPRNQTGVSCIPGGFFTNWAIREAWFQIGKGVCQDCILSPWLFNLYAKYMMQNTGLDEARAGIKIARRNINNLKYTDDPTLTAEREEELKWFLMKVKGQWKSWLKTQYSKNEDHGVRSHHCMANRWGNNGNSDRLYFPWIQNHCVWWLEPWNEDACSLEEKLWAN